MLVIVSPSKSQTPQVITGIEPTQPLFAESAASLAARLQKLGANGIAELMGISPVLAQSTFQRCRDFSTPHRPENSGSALATFCGDAFSAVSATSYNQAELTFAQSHLRILSGLYGLLRPLDLMQPYRLEMATRGLLPQAASLYEFWGHRISEQLNGELAGHRHKIIINCASREYSRVVVPKAISARILTASFKQESGGKLKTIAIYAKRARGLFVDWLIRNLVDDPQHLPSFSEGGYRYAEECSAKDEIVFVMRL